MFSWTKSAQGVIGHMHVNPSNVLTLIIAQQLKWEKNKGKSQCFGVINMVSITRAQLIY